MNHYDQPIRLSRPGLIFKAQTREACRKAWEKWDKRQPDTTPLYAYTHPLNLIVYGLTLMKEWFNDNPAH